MAGDETDWVDTGVEQWALWTPGDGFHVPYFGAAVLPAQQKVAAEGMAQRNAHLGWRPVLLRLMLDPEQCPHNWVGEGVGEYGQSWRCEMCEARNP